MWTGLKSPSLVSGGCPTAQTKRSYSVGLYTWEYFLTISLVFISDATCRHGDCDVIIASNLCFSSRVSATNQLLSGKKILSNSSNAVICTKKTSSIGFKFFGNHFKRESSFEKEFSETKENEIQILVNLTDTCEGDHQLRQIKTATNWANFAAKIHAYFVVVKAKTPFNLQKPKNNNQICNC